jgi:outer membrane protein TolC
MVKIIQCLNSNGFQVFLGAIFVFGFHFAAMAVDLSLTEALRLGLKHSEEIRSQEKRVEKLENDMKVVRSDLFPTIKAETFFRDQEEAYNTAGRTDSTGTRLVGSYDLLSLLSDSSSVRAKKIEWMSEKAKLQLTKAEYSRAVARSFYDISELQSDIQILRKALQTSAGRVSEIQKKVGIGRIRKSELLTAQVQKGELEIKLQEADEKMLRAMREFEKATGIRSGLSDGGATEEVDLSRVQFIATSLVVREMDSRQSYLDKIARHAAVELANLKIQHKEALLRDKKSGYLPSLDLAGNYYLARDGQNEDNKWDVGLTLSWELFGGGGTVYSVRSAASDVEIEKSQKELQIKTLQTDFENLFVSVEGFEKQLVIAAQNLKTAQEAYSILAREYQYGQSTNIEVLQSLISSLEAERTMVRIRNSLLTARHELAFLVGEI